MAKVLCLVKIKSSQGMRTHVLDKETFTIGRSQEADIPTLSPSTSRLHIAVKVLPNEVLIVDQGSANGTLVDGQKLPANRPMALTINSLVKLGTSEDEYQFQVVENPIEVMDLSDQRKLLKQQLAEIQKYFENQALEEAKPKIEALQLVADKEINEKKQLMDMQIQEQISKAKASSKEILELANKEADKLLAEMTESARARRQEIEAENHQLETEFRQQLANQKLEAQGKADEVLEEARSKASAIVSDGQSKAENLVKEAQGKSVDLLKQSDQQSEELLKRARSEAAKIRSEAMQEAQEIRDHAFKQSQISLDEAKLEGQQLVESIKLRVQTSIEEQTAQHREHLSEERRVAQKELEVYSLRSKEKAEQEARLAQDNIVKSYRSQIKELEQSLQNLKTANEQEQKNLTKLTHLCKEEERVLQKTKQQLSELQSELPELLQQKQEALAMLKKVESAEALMEQAKSERAKALSELEKFQRELHEGRAKIDTELKSAKERAILEQQELRKQQEEELARHKLKALEDLQKQIDKEERKFIELKQNQANEIARNMELALIPRMKEALKEGSDPVLGEMRHDIYKVVTSALSLDTSFVAHTEHLTVDPEEKTKARRQNIKWGGLAAASVLAILIYWKREQIMQTFRDDEKNSYAVQMMEERRRLSQFNPEQTEDFRLTYTDNVIYNRNYLEIKTNQDYVNAWTLELNNLERLREMQLSEEDIIQFVAKEFNLIQRLGELRKNIDAVYLDQGLERMREVESEGLEELKSILKSEKNFSRLMKMQEKSIAKHRADLSLRQADQPAIAE